jgi:uncharacterized protein (TIGR02271 family)
MKKLVTAVYDTSSEANKAIDRLKDENIDSSNIELIEYSEKKEEHGFFKSLFNVGGGKNLEQKDLAKMGIPREDTEFYKNAVRNGCSLVIVKCDAAESDHVHAILSSFNLSNIGEAPSKRGAGRSQETMGTSTGAGMTGGTETGAEGLHGKGREHRGEQHGEGAQMGGKYEEIEEELHVGKEEVETGGVSVSTSVSEEEVEEDVRLREEHIDVERRSVDRPAEAGEATFQEEQMEFTETREEPVAQKEARVTEEVHVGKEVDERTERISDTVRHQKVNVKDLSDSARESGRYDQFEPDLRHHYGETYGKGEGGEFEEYSIAYRYGMGLAQHDTLRDDNWSDAEPQARQGWESHNEGTWAKFKDAVRYGWNRIRGEDEGERPRAR